MKEAVICHSIELNCYFLHKETEAQRVSCVPVDNQQGKSGFEPGFLEAPALSLILMPPYNSSPAFAIPQAPLGD